MEDFEFTGYNKVVVLEKITYSVKARSYDEAVSRIKQAFNKDDGEKLRRGLEDIGEIELYECKDDKAEREELLPQDYKNGNVTFRIVDDHHNEIISNEINLEF